MFHNKISYKKTEQMQKKVYEIYNEPRMSLEKLLTYDQGISDHRKHLKTLLTEI